MCIVGEMAQDVGMHGVNVLWYHSHLVWLVFEGSIPTCIHLFSFGNLFCDLFLLFLCLFVCLFFNFFLIVREKRGEKGRRGEDTWSVKYESIELSCSQRTIIINSNASK